jgi:DNA replication protein DnaC
METLPNPTTPKASNIRKCCECYADFEWKGMPGMPVNYVPFDPKCPECLRKQSERDDRIRAARLMAKEETAMSEIPPGFRNTSRKLLPHPEKLDEALAWKFGRRGLLCLGPTRCGKSRILWEVAKREIKAGKSVRSVTPYELLKYPALFMAGNDAAGKFAETLATVDLLLLDDVFKAKLTERVEELIFAIIDERSAWDRPCLVTVNETGATLAESADVQRSRAGAD